MANVVQIVIKALDQTKAAFVGPIKNLEDLGKRAETASKVLLGVGVAAAGGLSVLVKNAIDAAEEVGKMSEKVGVSTENLSTLATNSEKLQSLGDAFRHLNKAIAENDPVVTQFTKGQRDTYQAFLNLSDVFNAYSDGAGKTTLASKAFGKEVGVDMIPLLNKGSQGIKDLQEKNRALGSEIDSNTSKQAREFNKVLSDLRVSFQGIALGIAKEILPALNDLSKWFSDQQNKSLDDTWVGVLLRAVKGTAYTAKAAGQAVADLAAAAGQAAGDPNNRAAIDKMFDTMKDNAKKNASAIYDAFAGTNKKIAEDSEKTTGNKPELFFRRGRRQSRIRRRTDEVKGH